MSAPIPLSQLGGGGGDNTMMYVGILACCCLVSSSGAGAAFVMNRKKSGATRASKMSRRAPRPRRAPRRAPRRIRRAPRRAPRPRRVPRRAPRRIRKFKIRKPRFRMRRRGGKTGKPRRAPRRIRKFKFKGFGKRRRRRGGKTGKRRKFKIRRPRFGKRRKRGGKTGKRRKFKFKGFGKRRRRRCFSPETPVKLQNGETRAMKNIELGDILVNGSIVKATMQIKNESDPYYKLPGNILVTGSHYIKDGDTYKHVKKYTGAEATTQVDPIVSCLITNDHKIPVGDFIFWDWEDNLVHQ